MRGVSEATPSAGDPGPYLELAVLCERVLEERDGVLSLVRLVDRLEVTVPGPAGAAGPAALAPVQLFAVVGFKSGQVRGRHQLRLTLERPDGLRRLLAELPLLFEGEDRGARAIVGLGFSLELEGLYWVDVQLDERWFMRMPLRVVYLAYRTG